MGWTYRPSVRFGPVRVNLSGSGIGYSVGGAGFRVGVRANGRQYTRMSIPGTGLSYTTTGAHSAATGCLVLLIVPFGLASFWAATRFL